MNQLIPFLLFTLSTSLTPGPNNFMLLSSGLNFGIQRSLPHYLGICFGFPLMVLLVSLGFGGLFQKFFWLKEILKILGSVYMLYLAWHIFIAHIDLKTETKAKPFGFFQAILFQWVNPKAWLMAVGAISVFTLSSHVFANALAISAIFFLVCLPCIAVWLCFGAAMKKFLKNPRQQHIFNRMMALCLVISVVLMWFE